MNAEQARAATAEALARAKSDEIKAVRSQIKASVMRTRSSTSTPSLYQETVDWLESEGYRVTFRPAIGYMFTSVPACWTISWAKEEPKA